MHLGLDALFEAELALGEHLGRDVRAQIAGHGVDGLVFLFDADGEGRAHERQGTGCSRSGIGGTSRAQTLIQDFSYDLDFAFGVLLGGLFFGRRH